MKTRYGLSPWIDQFPSSRRPSFPSLRGAHDVDVVIVGGGLTGCATALACATAGLKTILLEAGRIGQGAAGHSAGLLLPEPGPMFREVAAQLGARNARRAFDSWRRASLDGAALLRRLKIRCALEPISTFTATTRDGEKALRREFDARVEGGAAATWLTSRQVGPALGLENAAAAIRTRDAFAIDPYRAVIGLAGAAKSRRVRLFEETRVKKVTFTRKDATLFTADATIRTNKVVVTTGSATAEYSQLRRHFTPRETYLVMTEPLPAAMRKGIGQDLTFRDTHAPRRRVRWTEDARLIVAGGDQEPPPDRQRPAVRMQRTGQLMYELLTMFPQISGLKPAYQWELGYGDTADGLMYIGPHRNYPHHVFALGGSGDSVTGAFLAARVVTRAVQEASEKGDEVFGFLR
jgi:glycine/D-amino acid oxidase-like deaminating enzyme